MPTLPAPSARRPRRDRVRVLAACAVASPLLAAAWLVDCVSSDGGPTPSCANGGVACLDASFDAESPTSDAPATLADGTVPDGSQPRGDGAAAVDAPATGDDSSAPTGDASDAATELDAPDAAEGDAAASTLVKVTLTDDPYYMTVGGGYVYWVDAAGGVVERVSVNGGTVTQISTVGALAMTADANNMYWVSTVGDIYQVAHTSTTPLKIWNEAFMPDLLVTDGTYVYWDAPGINASFGHVPIGGGDGGYITPTSLIYPSGIAFAGGATYVTLKNSTNDSDAGIVGVLPGDGGLPVTLLSGRAGPQQLITDGARLYWIENTALANSGIYSCSFDGGSLTAFTDDATQPKILTDGTWLYFTDTRAVWRQRADGSGAAEKIYMTSYPWALAQDATNLYWADRDDNAIYRAPKPQ